METKNMTPRDHIYILGKDPLSLSNDQFLQWTEQLPQDIRITLIEELREHKKFYSKILEEEYRKTHPFSPRYADAEQKVNIVNEKGKLLKSVINNHKS